MLKKKDEIKVKLLGISGSPRKSGNTEFLLKHALEAAEEVAEESIESEMYSIAGKTYFPCISCFACVELGYCVRGVKDDFPELRDKWLEADAVIMAVPIYHMSIPGQLKCFMDRLGNSLCAYYIYKLKNPMPKHLKVYGAIAQGVHLFSGQEHAITDIINHALWMGNVAVAGDFWESYIGGGGWTENLIEKDALESLYNKKSFDTETSVKACRSLGKRVAEMALIIKAGALQYLDYLEKDPVFKPFIDRIQK